ncbi:MAG: DUF934 domain-containing protein [Gammaproteobacteria bacterium]|jgi:uncharacterized protein (DUF934 family)
MALLKNGKPATDVFLDVSTAETIPPDGAIIVSLDQWQNSAAQLRARKEPLGIVLRSHEKPAAIAEDVQKFAVIALDFPAFGDGRAYSSARLLRERYKYQGELRAVGDVLLEQLHFMHRVGFDAFELASEDAARDWQIAASDISVWYQPTSDGRPHALRLRHQAAGDN